MDFKQASTESYLYKPLHNAKKDIRLLLLHGREENKLEDDTIRCSLQHIPLQNATSFEALSYVWGEAAGERAILLNGQRYTTTNNLYTALVHLRRNNEDRCLWIDALCIDQTSINERKDQVAQMHLIYRQASSVTVFLGELWEGFDAVKDMIEAGSRRSLHWSPSLQPHVVAQGMDTGSKVLQGYIHEFLSTPWWSRLWTVQEYCLARHVIFQHGDRIIDNAVLERCVDNYYYHREVCCKNSEPFTDPQSSNPLEKRSLSTGLDKLLRLCMYRRVGNPRYLITISDFRSRQCLDPLDKIYSILGLLNQHVRDLVTPDYTRSPREVYEEVALATIRATESFDTLSFVYGERTASLSIPSLVPDWTAQVDPWTYEPLRIRERQIKLYNASNGTSVDLHDAAPGGITASGIFGDQTAAFAKEDLSRSTLLACRNLANFDDNTEGVYADKRTAFWHTLCGGMISDWPQGLHKELSYRSIDESDFPLFQRWQEYIDADMARGVIDLEIHRFHLAFVVVSALRRFIVTEKGYMGWAPVDVEVGDTVVLLSGGKVPYVLRPAKGEMTSAVEASGIVSDGRDETEPRSYTFVGDAYVHGMMQGECYKDKLDVFRLV
ncbi:hypothetical protein EKO04_004716 [Ascochyta lentis]|uniref:Heterokaryon incompatibility domain-containing protein n=1 Tax=Ascochyta lentis TaxID=205686 RepID=A0A8H7MHW0_9PLEO|nr:hypothetical protein EKO04_004716 [Ascochyta lentis]